MASTKPVRIRYSSGAEYVVTSPAAAAKLHPDAKIVRYEDGTAYEAPKPRAPRPSRAKRAKASAPAVPSEEATDGANS